MSDDVLRLTVAETVQIERALAPVVHLEPRVDDDARTVIAAADHVAELLPKPARTFSIGDHLDPVTWAAMKEMARHVV